MFTTWRPSEEYVDVAANGALASMGLKSPLIAVTWVPTAPSAIYMASQNPTFMSAGGSHRGRFKIAYTPEPGVKAFRWWIVDETADANEPDGYQFFNYEGYNDGTPPSAPRSFDMSEADFFPPAVFYVSSLRHEKRLLVIEPYRAWNADTGEPSGAPLPEITIELSPPTALSATVTMEAPDGYVSSRWRKISFGVEPMDWRLLGDSFVATGDIISPTRVRSQNFSWPNGTYKHNGDRRNDVFMWRARTRMGALSPSAWPGQSQFRRVVEAGAVSGFNGYIEYDRPFDPPLAEGDLFWIIDKCVMARVWQSPTFALDMNTDWRPVLGRMFLDTWALQDNYFGSSAGSNMPYPHEDWARRFVVEFYYHDANYGPYGTSGFGEFEQALNAPRDESEIQNIVIRAPAAPFVGKVRVLESQINAGKMRVEVDNFVGDVNRWRLYARAGGSVSTPDLDWPTIEEEKWNAPPDEAYFVGEYSRHQRYVETMIDVNADSVMRVVVVPVTFDGERSAGSSQVRVSGVEIQAIFYGLEVYPEDAGTENPRHRLNWQSNGAAQDGLFGFRIEHHRRNHEGESIGENPTTVLWSGNNLAVAGTFLHDGAADPRAAIDIRAPQNILSYSRDHYVVTHCYELVLVNAGGTEVARQKIEFTDRYTRAREADVSLGTLTATLLGEGTLDGAGRVVEPVTVSLGFTPRNFQYRGTQQAFTVSVYYEYSIDGKATGDGSKVWYPISADNRVSMHMTHTPHLTRHQIWGKQVVASGGTVYPLVYRAYFKQSSDGFSARRGTAFSTPFNIRLADVVAPGPF